MGAWCCCPMAADAGPAASSTMARPQGPARALRVGPVALGAGKGPAGPPFPGLHSRLTLPAALRVSAAPGLHAAARHRPMKREQSPSQGRGGTGLAGLAPPLASPLGKAGATGDQGVFHANGRRSGKRAKTAPLHCALVHGSGIRNSPCFRKPPMQTDETGSPVATSVTARLYDALLQDIVSGRIAPGEKLSEPVIARRFGASRAPVREAIRRLQERALVTYVVHQGVRVTEPSAAQFLALLDVREATEGMAARLAAGAMGAAERAALVALVASHRDEIERDPHGAYLQDQAEADFHWRIASGSGNAILAELLSDQFYPRLRLCRRLHATLARRGQHAWQEHVRIAEAISQRDGELAEVLMRRHIRAARSALEQALAAAAAGRPTHPPPRHDDLGPAPWPVA